METAQSELEQAGIDLQMEVVDRQTLPRQHPQGPAAGATYHSGSALPVSPTST